MSLIDANERIKELEELLKNMTIEHPICHWATYSGSHCRRSIDSSIEGSLFCNKHYQMFENYKLVDESDICSTFQEFKVVPRSYAHIKSVMKSINNEDDLVDVFMSKGFTEEADLSDHSCVTILSDNYQFFYSPKRGQANAKNIKIILKNYCKNNSVIKIEDTHYCEDCFRKIKGVPKISIVKERNTEIKKKL